MWPGIRIHRAKNTFPTESLPSPPHRNNWSQFLQCFVLLCFPPQCIWPVDLTTCQWMQLQNTLKNYAKTSPRVIQSQWQKLHTQGLPGNLHQCWSDWICDPQILIILNAFAVLCLLMFGPLFSVSFAFISCRFMSVSCAYLLNSFLLSFPLFIFHLYCFHSRRCQKEQPLHTLTYAVIVGPRSPSFLSFPFICCLSFSICLG